MTKDEMIQFAFNQRVKFLIEQFYDPRWSDIYPDFVWRSMQGECIQRLKEVLYLAEDIGLIDFKDYDTCLGIITYMGTNADMEERLW